MAAVALNHVRELGRRGRDTPWRVHGVLDFLDKLVGVGLPEGVPRLLALEAVEFSEEWVSHAYSLSHSTLPR